MTMILLLILSAASPGELEAAGRLFEAGAAWEARGDVPGQARVMVSMLEDALYSADVRRAWLLAGELAGMGVDRALLDFWKARIAWSSGLGSEASLMLSRVETDDEWLHYRAKGLSLLYGGDPEGAVEMLALSLNAAETSRRGFYSGLDLCTALFASGEVDKAVDAAQILLSLFPREPLAKVMMGLCLQLSGSSAAALRQLSSLSPQDAPGARAMAARLLQEFVE